MSKKIKAIFESIENEAASLAKAWKIDRKNGTFQINPKSKLYQYWKRQGKLEEYLYNFGRYKSLENLLEYTSDGNDLTDLIEVYTDKQKGIEEQEKIENSRNEIDLTLYF